MKILFVWPCVTFSVWDVARGYRNALGKILGETNIQDYYLDKRIAYHQRAIPVEAQNETVLAKYASETVLNEALYFQADLVIIVSGLNFHPIGLWLLERAGIKTITIMTESPYNDDSQADWASVFPEMQIVTTERTSAKEYGWEYIPHAYDPQVHCPMKSDKELECDVLLVGTGWPERQRILEKVNWEGIKLKLFGLWPNMDKYNVLNQFHTSGMIDNVDLPRYYASAKICLNIHRGHETAESMNPRAYEIAACGAYQICDTRQEVSEMFGESVPVIKTAALLDYEIRWALSHPQERIARAQESRKRILSHTFEPRARALLSAVGYGGKPPEKPIETALETTFG